MGYVTCQTCGKVKSNTGEEIIRTDEWTVSGRYVIFVIHTNVTGREMTIKDLTFAERKLTVVATVQHRPAHWVAWLRHESGWWCCNDMVVTEVQDLPKGSNLVVFTQLA